MWFGQWGLYALVVGLIMALLINLALGLNLYIGWMIFSGLIWIAAVVGWQKNYAREDR